MCLMPTKLSTWQGPKQNTSKVQSRLLTELPVLKVCSTFFTVCLFRDPRCFFMGNREIALVPSRDGNYENDVEEKQKVNFEHLFSIEISKAMTSPSALLVILLSTPHCLVGNCSVVEILGYISSNIPVLSELQSHSYLEILFT